MTPEQMTDIEQARLALDMLHLIAATYGALLVIWAPVRWLRITGVLCVVTAVAFAIWGR